jgi:hypothetical protein
MSASKVMVILGAMALCGCVSGAPSLTTEQHGQVSAVQVFKAGSPGPAHYQSLGTLSAADCSGAPGGGRVWGDAEKAIETLKEKAVVAGADALIDVSCSAAPMVNNCWSAQKCTGQAVKTAPAEHH